MTDKRITRFGQIRVYAGKCFRLFVSEKQWKNILSACIIILLISCVTSKKMFVEYADTKNGVFAVICACIWVGLFNSIQSVCRERDIVKREHRTGLHISSYILAHVLYEMALCAAETLIVLLVLIIRNHSHLPPEGLVLGAVPDMFITLYLVTFGSDMLALLISCIVRTTNSAMTVMPFVLIIQLVMSGAAFELHGISEAVSYATLSRWGMDGMGSIANTANKVWAQYRVNGADEWTPSSEHLLKVWLILLGFIVLYILIAMIALRQVDKDER